MKEKLRNGGRCCPSIHPCLVRMCPPTSSCISWLCPFLHPCLTWMYSVTLSVVCTGSGLAAVICGYEGWTPAFVNIGQKNFVRFSFFLGLILIVLVMVWNLSATLFVKMSTQLYDRLRNNREPCESPRSDFKSYNQQKRRIFSQISGLLMLGFLLACMVLELAGTGYLWYVFVQVSKVHQRHSDNKLINFCDAKYSEAVCQEAYLHFQGWFHMFRVLLPLLAVLQLPALLVNCFGWVLVDLELGHPLSPVQKPNNSSVSFSFSHPKEPVNYYGNMTLPERPQPIGQELTPKLATAGTSRGFSHKPVCVPCPKAPVAAVQAKSPCFASTKLGDVQYAQVSGSQVSTPVSGSFRGTIHHEKSSSLKKDPQCFTSFNIPLERNTGDTCDDNSSRIDTYESRVVDGGRIKSCETSPHFANQRTDHFSPLSNQEYSVNTSCTKQRLNSSRNILTNGVLPKPAVLNKNHFPRSKLPSPPPPPTGSSTQKTTCSVNRSSSPSRPGRWTTNQVAISSVDPVLLPKVAQAEKYASLSRFKPVCTIENI